MIQERLERKLRGELGPEELVIVDRSERHRGHAGWREGGETHFHVRIVANAFQGVSRLERQRMVHRLLADELADRVHALTLDLKTPAEAEKEEAP